VKNPYPSLAACLYKFGVLEDTRPPGVADSTSETNRWLAALLANDPAKRPIHCTELNLTAPELAILCACWYVRTQAVAESSTFIPPQLFQFQEDLLIPGARRRERLEIKHPLPILQQTIQILTREDSLIDPEQHSTWSTEQEKSYLRKCCELTSSTGLPQFYRIKETQRFQLFASLIWAFYAARIESSEIQEEETDVLPDEIINAQEIYRENFNLPHHRFVAARQINNEARRILHAIRTEIVDLLPNTEKERWLTKTEQQINDDIFTTRQAVLKGYISKEDADQLRELEEAEHRVEENARKKRLKPEDETDDFELGEIPTERFDSSSTS